MQRNLIFKIEEKMNIIISMEIKEKWKINRHNESSNMITPFIYLTVNLF